MKLTDIYEDILYYGSVEEALNSMDYDLLATELANFHAEKMPKVASRNGVLSPGVVFSFLYFLKDEAHVPIPEEFFEDKVNMVVSKGRWKSLSLTNRYFKISSHSDYFDDFKDVEFEYAGDK